MSTTRYTLHYFDSRGRAEPVRLLLTHVGAEWIDQSFPGADWTKVKPDMPLGQVPVLAEERDGRRRLIPQSQAILRHVARAHGADGKTEEERLDADVMAETALDFAAALSRLRFSPGWDDPAARAKYAAETIPQHLSRLETVLAGKSWAAGSGPTYADLAAFDVLDNHQAAFPGCLDGHAGLLGWMERVKGLPTLAAYWAKRRPAPR